MQRKWLARYSRVPRARREHQAELFRDERLLSVVRARIRLEPHGDLRRVFAGANRVRPVGSVGRICNGSARPAQDDVYRHDRLRGGFFFLSLVYSLPMLYVVIILGIVMGSSLGNNMPVSVAIAQVFRERRSLAFGIYRMGPGLWVFWCRSSAG